MSVSASLVRSAVAVMFLAGSMAIGRSALAGEAADPRGGADGHADVHDTAAAEGRLLPTLPAPTSGSAALLADGVLHLTWIDPRDSAGASAGGAREEAARVFKTMGIAVQWRRAEPREMGRPGEIRVIVLDRLLKRAGNTVVLGATPSRLPDWRFVWIHLPSVREALRVSGPSVGSLELASQYRLGIALGRVIAHEVVHAVAPALPHGSGLMAERLTAADLTTAALRVPPEVAAAVRTALAGTAPPATSAAGPELLAAEHARH